MKDETRQGAILELIKKQPIYTQQQLLQQLHACGFDVTQATVSRDIKKLGLVQLPGNQGKKIYTKLPYQPEMDEKIMNQELSLQTILRQSVMDVDYGMNMVVIKCREGFANAACAAFEQMEFEDVVGTIAGDNTFFVLMRSMEQAEYCIQKIRQVLQ